MTYKFGKCYGMRRLGFTPCDPHFVCDGCGAVRPVVRPGASNMMPGQWFLDGKPPPDWRSLRMVSGEKRWDLCPRCWKAKET